MTILVSRSHKNTCFSDFSQSASIVRLLQQADLSNHAAAFAWRGQYCVNKFKFSNFQVTLDSITVRWEEPRRLPQDAPQISYTLAYASQDEDGNLGDFEEVADLLDTTTIINGLAMDALYAFKAKVRC